MHLSKVLPNCIIILTTLCWQRHFAVSANSIVVIPSEKIAIDPGHSLTIQCNDSGNLQAQFRWFKINENQMKPDSIEMPLDSDKRIIITRNELKFKTLNYHDAGEYICRSSGEGDEEKQKKITLLSRPYIDELESGYQSNLVMVGDKLQLECRARNSMQPSQSIDIQWYRSKFSDDETEMESIPSDDDRFTIEESSNKTSKILTIKSIQRDDRRFYECRANNDGAESKRNIYIRIKDPLAVVWPAVGIIMELFIIFSVIFVSENRKIQPESIDDTAMMSKPRK